MTSKVLTFILDTVEPEIGTAVTEFTKALEVAGHVVKEIRQTTDKGEIKIKVPHVVQDGVDVIDDGINDAVKVLDEVTPATVPSAEGTPPTAVPTPSPVSETPTEEEAAAKAGFDALTYDEQQAVLAEEEAEEAAAKAAMSGSTTTADEVNSGSSPNPLGSIPVV